MYDPERQMTVACVKDGRKFVAVYEPGDEYNQRGYYELSEDVRHAEVDAWRPVGFPEPNND